MKRDDLLKMLDLSGKEARPATEEELLQPGATHPTEAASPTALKLDEWARRRGRQLLDEGERLQTLGLDADAMADFHGAAFEPDPILEGSCVDPQRLDFLTQLLETPDYKSLHTSTMLNALSATIAATAFAEQFAELKKDEATEAGAAEGDREMQTLRAVGRALNHADREVEEARESLAAMGMGLGSAGSNDAKAIAEVYRRVRNNKDLQRICALAGRYRRVAQSRQRRKVVHGMDDVVGVVTDNDLGRLLPHELAKLAIPEFEEDTLRRLVERQTMCRAYRSTERVGKGPIIVSVDESGSMEGDKIHTAKALALALAWIARHQQRWCGLIAYSGESGERLLSLPPGRWDESALMDWLSEFLSFGSTLDVPVRELPEYYNRLGAPHGNTDVIILTDALCRIPPELQDRFNAWKAQVQARVISLIIGSSPADLAGISDEVHTVASLHASEGAVERVLSI